VGDVRPLPLAAGESDLAWSLLLGLLRRVRAGNPVIRRAGVVLDEHGQTRDVAPNEGWITIDPNREPCWTASRGPSPDAAQLFDLYLPFCVGQGSVDLVIGHVGQSLDGFIALPNGESRYVTGRENIRHLHRLRALSDAVIVGRETLERDDPQLTTRLVPGEHPARVVLDPGRRLSPGRRIFRDGAARTIIVTSVEAAASTPAPPGVEVLAIATHGGRLLLPQVLEALRARGLRRLFVEGGGVTISRFVEAGVLDRLHVTVAPLFLGAGRRGVELPPARRLAGALRPRCRRFLLGPDVLFDCEMHA
jgi:riboflavin-specific deaminase-like protein